MAASRHIVWLNVVTVISAAILIGAEVFGAAFAGSWALATLFDLGNVGQRILDGVFVLCGIAVMAQFIRYAHRIEPFTARGRASASRRAWRLLKKLRKFCALRTISLASREKFVISTVPKFARACGRVSVGR